MAAEIRGKSITFDNGVTATFFREEHITRKGDSIEVSLLCYVSEESPTHFSQISFSAPAGQFPELSAGVDELVTTLGENYIDNFRQPEA